MVVIVVVEGIAESLIIIIRVVSLVEHRRRNRFKRRVLYLGFRMQNLIIGTVMLMLMILTVISLGVMVKINMEEGT